MDPILKYWPIFWSIANVLALWATWSFKRALPSHADVKAVADSVDALEESVDDNIDEIKVRVSEQATTIARLEEAVKRAPTHTDIKELSKRIEELHGDLKEVVGGLSGIRRAVDLMNEYLLNNNGGR